MTDMPAPFPAALRAPWVLWTSLVAAAVLGSEALQRSGLPGAYLLGPLVVAAIFALRGSGLKMPNLPYVFAQATSGCLVGSYIQSSVISDVMSFWPFILISAVMTIVMSILTGVVIGRLTGIDKRLAVWGFMPGLAPIMIAMADERGMDGRQVAVMQIFRLVFVIVAVIGLGSLLHDKAPVAAIAPATPALTALLISLAIIVVGVWAGYRVKFIPAPATLIPIALSGLIAGTGASEVYLPDMLFNAALAIIGLQVGLRLTAQLLRQSLRQLPAIGLGFVILMVLCFGLALILLWIGATDLMSAILSTVPGSIDTIGVLAVANGASVSFVIAVQTVRLVVLTTLGPAIADWFCRRW